MRWGLVLLRRQTAAVLLTCAWLIAAGGPAAAQAPGPTAEVATAEIEEIVVTGSRIIRRDFNAPSPIATVDREAIENSGLRTLEAALNQMPQIIPAFDRSSNQGDGTAQVNLRGLGANRTLVLLNGRRLAPSGVGSTVDVNNLPQVLVERVEVITGGASAIYGSDAVSGVVNFITRDDFEGFALDASFYSTEYGDSEAYDVNLTWGREIGDGRGNLTLFGGYFDRQATFAADREFTSVPWIDDWEGNLFPGGSIATPAGVVVSNDPLMTFTPDGNPVEFDFDNGFYNYAPANYLQIPMQRYVGGLLLDYALTPSIETYVELTWTHNDVLLNLAPVPIFDSVVVNWDNPVLTPDTQALFADQFPVDSPPWPPNSAAFALRRRLVELGPRQLDYDSDFGRLVAGLRGDISTDWNYDVWVTYTTGDEEDRQLNDASYSRLQQGLLVDPATGQCYDTSNGCVPLDLFGEGRLSAEDLAFISIPPLVNTTTREQFSFSGFLRGAPLRLWAGDVETAVGLEWRRDEGDFEADAALFTGDSLGYSGDAPVIGSETVYELYGEAVVPLARNLRFAEYLALELGARYSDYEHAGPVDTYRFGANWQLNDSILVRSMFQRSVRAPNLYEAFQQQYIVEDAYSYPDAPDPCSASAEPVENGFRDKCIATGLPADQVGVFEATDFFPAQFIYGGNPELEPEQADSLTLGVVLDFDAWTAWQVSVDYFDISIEDSIGDLDAHAVCFDLANTENLFCGNFTRDPATYNVIRVYAPKVNRGLMQAVGFDTQVSFGVELPGIPSLASATDLDVRVFWTHLLGHSVQQFRGGTTWECAGKFGWPCWTFDFGGTFPEDRVTTTADFHAGPLTMNLAWRWIGSSGTAVDYAAPFFGVTDPDPAVTSVSSRQYVDLGFGYRFSESVEMRLTISNLLEEDPPMMADAVSLNNTDTSMYDVFGRSYSLNFSWQLVN